MIKQKDIEALFESANDNGDYRTLCSMIISGTEMTHDSALKVVNIIEEVANDIQYYSFSEGNLRRQEHLKTLRRRLLKANEPLTDILLRTTIGVSRLKQELEQHKLFRSNDN